MVISLLIILAIVLGSKVVYKDNFAILTGTITGNGTDSPSDTINYPEGFSKDNCVVLTANMQRTPQQSKSYGSVYDGSSSISGSIPLRVSLSSDNILIEYRIINLREGGVTITTTPASVSHTYTIVLMKIGD